MKKKNKKKAKSNTAGVINPVPIIRKKTEKKPLSRTARILLFILIGVLSLGALAGGFFGIRALVVRDYNYLESDLSRYVTLSAEGLKNIRLTVRVDKPTEEDMEREILALRVQHKTLAEGISDSDAVIQNGSTVKFFYSGYLLSENGTREYFSGGSNLSSSSPYKLTIGSAGFIPGFEAGMVGIRPSDTEIPTIITEGTMEAGDVVYVNITGFHPNGKGMNFGGQRIVLTPEIDAEYGEGFYELLLGKDLSENLCEATTVLPSTVSGEGDFMYTKIQPLYKAEGGKAHTVAGYFPMNYEETSLAGKTAYFEVYIQDTTTYDLPEFTDAFLTDTVGIVAERLAEYEGETLTEKYRNYLWEALMEDYESRLLEACEQSFWEKIVEIATVKRVPRAAWLEIYDDYMADMKKTYDEYLKTEGYTSAMYPYDSFCRDYLRMEEGLDYKDYVRELSKQTAGEKMIFFYAIQLLEVCPSESELAAERDAILTEFAKEYIGIDESYYQDVTDPAEKQAAYEEYMSNLESMKTQLEASFGEEYLLESAYYNLAFPKLLSLAKINYVGKGHNS